MFYLSTYIQWFVSYRRNTAEQDDLSASAIPKVHNQIQFAEPSYSL